MSSLLQVSPKKKRAPASDDESITTPKRLRTASLVSPFKPPTSRSVASTLLPPHLARIQTIYISLQHALSVALATSAISPSVDTGRLPNVLNQLSLSTATGFTLNCDITDIKKLCWLWEWDGKSIPASASEQKLAMDDDDNPFFVPDTPSDWTRGAMGFIVTPTTHFMRSEGKRMSTYGIGIEVEMDLASGKGGGMAAVARWTAGGQERRRQIEAKLREWVKLNPAEPVPGLPLADLPILPRATKPSSLTKLFAKSSTSSTPKSPNIGPIFAECSPIEFAVSFPVTPLTPSTSPSKPGLELESSRYPQTPQRPIGRGTATMPQTPTTSRRAALYERIRQKSLTSTPSSVMKASGVGPVSNDKRRILGQEELRRRCLLGRLDEVAATVWALFSSPAQTSSTPFSVSRKRRTMQTQEIVGALVTSATVPISQADARDSITLLMTLCPFFLRPLVVAGEDWAEMPASNPSSSGDSGEEVLSRSPKSVKAERGGLREVRERIRRELEVGG